jgi:triacylglycerol lipase
VQNHTAPVVLVHGWRSHPGIWNRLTTRLEEAGIPFRTFTHRGMDGSASVAEIATALQEYIGEQREQSGYEGPVDIVCHSMGTSITRYMLEVLDGETRNEQVRQLIGVGPLNKGSAMAELFNHPEYGPEVIKRLAGVFVPTNYNPAADIIVQQVRPESATMGALQAAGLREDITYRFIMAGNTTGTRDFFPWFEGRTWELSPEGKWCFTFGGDGIVAHSESFLPGTTCEILPADPKSMQECPDMYCHIKLPRNPEVVDRVMQYICNPFNGDSEK